MPVSEIVAAAVADAVFGYIVEEYGALLEDRVRDLLGREPTKKAFKEALENAFEELRIRYPQWVAENFDASFFKYEGKSVLAQFLIRDGNPDPSELAARWADSLNIQQPERRTLYTRELEPIATHFLDTLAHQLKSKTALRELNDSRAFEQLLQTVQEIRDRLGAEKATPGTRRDYLRWLIDRNLYLDPRGTFQTQRQVQVKLDEVYISLKAHLFEVMAKKRME